MTEDHVEIKTIKMSNGIDFPMIGLGTFRVFIYLINFISYVFNH
jgi:hypothetical protein